MSTKEQAVSKAIEALESDEVNRAVVGLHPTFGWVWVDWEDSARIAELDEAEEVKLW